MRKNKLESSAEHMPTVRQTGRNILAIWGNRIFAIITPLILTPIITHHFGLEITGIWLMATQLAAHLMLLDVGFTNSLVRYLAGQRAADNSIKASGYFSTAFLVLLSISLMLLIASPFIGSYFLHSLQITDLNAIDAEKLILLTIIYVAISLPMRVGQGLVASIHRFDLIQLWDLFAIALRLIIILAMFYFYRPTLVYLGLAVYGTMLFSALAVFISGLKNNPKIILRTSLFSRAALGDLSSMGGAAIIVTSSSVLLMQTTPMLSGYIIGPASVLLIALPLMIYSSVTPFLATLSLIIAPVAAGMSAKGEKQDLLPIFTMAARYHSSASMLIFLVIVGSGSTLITSWLSGPKLGPSELQSISTGVIILFAGFSVSSVAQLGRSILASVGSHWPVALTEFITASIGVLLGYYLTIIADFGVIGMLIGVSASLIIRSLICYPLLLGKYFLISPSTLLVKAFGSPLIVTCITAVSGWVILRGLTHYSLGNEMLRYLLALSVFMLLWVVLGWYLIVPSSHREILRKFFVRRIKLG